jgi:hypothetical protein
MAEPPATPILYLDVDDEITSVAARIRRLDGDRAVLVVPFGSRVATSRINFRLLAREATERGVTVEIVAADASARALAASAGLVVHPSVAAFEGRGAGDAAARVEPAGAGTGAPPEDAADDDTATRLMAVPAGQDAAAAQSAAASAAAHPGLAQPRDRGPIPLVGPVRPPIRRGAAAGVGVALVLLLVVGAWAAIVVLPSATISLAPRSADAGPIELTVEARTDVTAPDATALVIPARRFTFDVAASATFPATGVKITETKATGNVTFSNFDTGDPAMIPAGAIVATEGGIQFRTLADVTLPRATVDFFPPFPTRPSTSSVGVEAVLAGVTGNVGNNTITVIPKGYRKQTLLVSNPDATTGGERGESPQVSQADVDAALLALQDGLVAALDETVADPPGIPVGTQLFAQTALITESAPTVDPASLVGSDTAEFELGLTGSGSVLGVDPAPLNAVAEARLAARIPAGWQVADGSLDVAVGEPSVFGDVVTFPVTVRATQVRVVDRALILAQSQGLVLAEARARLEAYGDVEITLWPDWVTNVPTDASKVTVTILEPRPSASP